MTACTANIRSDGKDWMMRKKSEIIVSGPWKVLTIPLAEWEYDRLNNTIDKLLQDGNLPHDEAASLYDIKYLIVDEWINTGFVAETTLGNWLARLRSVFKIP